MTPQQAADKHQTDGYLRRYVSMYDFIILVSSTTKKSGIILKQKIARKIQGQCFHLSPPPPQIFHFCPLIVIMIQILFFSSQKFVTS